MALKLTWVNHASFILSDGSVSLISDPWLEGSAFNDSWNLLSPTVFTYDQFKSITHIWFSHEHPDHFAPAVIKKIPLEYRQNITVLYHHTVDKKVTEFCKTQGFKTIIQIYPNDKIRLSESMTVSCEKVTNDIDSWMLIETPWKKILNLNDCHFNCKPKRVKNLKKIIGKIDILFTQFSYAQWVGNRNQPAMHKWYAEEQLREMEMQLKILDPELVVPFASFVWFCHEENHFMNAQVNKIRDVYNLIPKWGEFKPLVFYPNDVWDMTEEWMGSEDAIRRYEYDFNKINAPGRLVNANTISLDELKLVSEEFRQRCMKDNNAKKILKLQPFTFYLTDYNRCFSFSYLDGMQNEIIKPGSADVSLSSQAIWYCFKNDWGFATLDISGRFEKPILGNFHRLENYRWVANLRNNGKKVPKMGERLWTRIKNAIVND